MMFLLLSNSEEDTQLVCDNYSSFSLNLGPNQ